MSTARPDPAGDTIYALATASGRAAIAIVRISGPQAHAVARDFTGRVPPPRRATLVTLRDPSNGERLDQALMLAFAAGASEVGEDGVEFHLHGSPAVVRAVLAALAGRPGLRPAEPGEFARRAFRNGRMDLPQLEGLADLVAADTDWQRKQAQRQLSGAMRDATAPWRAALIEATALVETAIDFAEDVELAATLPAAVATVIAPVRDGLRRELALAPAAERLRDGVQVVIAGPANAGKSTLLNALARREAAIVSSEAGTTRDPIEVHLELAGCAVTLVDTAGLRDASEPVERIGIARARQRAEAADLVLWLGSEAPPPGPAPVWRLAAKADLRGDDGAAGILAISARTGHNLDALLARLTTFAAEIATTGQAGLLARERHRLAFTSALDALDRIAADMPLELLAEQIRLARHALDRLIGTVDVEDVLDAIFSRFCIGK